MVVVRQRTFVLVCSTYVIETDIIKGSGLDNGLIRFTVALFVVAISDSGH